MKTPLIIGAWLLGAVAFAVVSYDDRCKKNPDDGWHAVFTMSVGALLWPAVAVARLAVFTFSPKYGMKALGCPAAHTSGNKTDG